MQFHDRVRPNAPLRLLQRELQGHSPGSAVHSARAFSECIFPTHKVLEVDSPDAHIGRFTQDGNHLVCFSLQLDSLILFDYLGPCPQLASSPSDPIGFNRFFQQRWRLLLCTGSEQLNRDFTLVLRGGAYVLLASSVPVRRDGPGRAAAGTAAGAAGAEAPAVAPGSPTEGGLPQAAVARDGVLVAPTGPATAADWAAYAADQSPVPEGDAPSGLQGGRSASSDLCEAVTFHVVDLQRSMKVGERRFIRDYFDLAGNACASLYDNVLALTSTHKQAIHLLYINQDGTLTDIQCIGRYCQADDHLPVELAAGAEQQWQLQRQRQRQQHDHSRQHKQQERVPRTKQHKQQHVATFHSSTAMQTETQQSGLGNSSRGAAPERQLAAEHLARARVAGGDEGSGSRFSDSTNEDSEDSDEMDRRERRRRRPADQLLPPQQLNSPPQQQQQQQQQQQPLPPGPGRAEQSSLQTALAAQAGAASAAAAAAVAVLDPGGQLLDGIQQRLLAFLFKCVVEQRPTEVAPTLRDFQYNFGVLSSLVVYRARLLDRQHLLLKLGAPTAGPAAAAELNPSRVHFFAVYDLHSTLVKGFWRASSAKLLNCFMADPQQLLAAGPDMSPWERCCAAALYPQGYLVGLGSQQLLQQQQQRELQRQQQGGQELTAQLLQQRLRSQQQGGSSSQGSRMSNRHAEVAPPAEQQRQQQQQATSSGTQRISAGVAVLAEPAASRLRNLPSDAALAAAATAAAPSTAGLSESVNADPSGSAGSGSNRGARERLKLLRQVVLLALPGLQSLSASAYLDPHLFAYSKHISPIMGLRNSAAEPLRFRLARRYHRGSEQRGSATGSAATAGQRTAEQGDPGPVQPERVTDLLQDHLHQHQHQRHEQQQDMPDILQLEPANPQSVMWGNEECVRRQLHLFHPTDPFVLTVVQTIAQPAVVSICYRS